MKKILAVDDSVINLKAIKNLLSGRYKIIAVNSCIDAFRYLKTDIPDLILLDVLMPDMDGFEMMKILKADSKLKNIPVIFITADNDKEKELDGFRLGALDFIIKPFEPDIVISRIDRTIELDTLRHNLEREVTEKTEEVERIILQSIMSVAKTVDSKDRHTAGHSFKVACYSEEIAKRMGLDNKKVRNIHYLALLHDIGKIALPDHILNKDGKYTTEEYQCMETHTTIGAQILSGIKSLSNAGDVALYHHERYDGTGYPCGLKGTDIPIEARIVGAADAYEAMTSDRSYRSKLSFGEIVQQIIMGRGKQFDPEICDILLDMMEEGFTASDEEAASEADETDIARESADLIQIVMKEYAQGYRMQASKDSLTGLWNRKYISNEVNAFLKNQNNHGALFMIDLDDFKNINDKFGHLAGDDILIQTARQIEDIAGEDNIACRVGGDEFMIFIRGCRDKDKLASIAKELISKLNSKVTIPDNDYVTAASVGISIAQNEGNTFAQLYGNADKALYLSKKKGKNTYQFYREDNDIMTGIMNATREDLSNIKKMLQEKGPVKGSYYVGYEGFKNIYQFLKRSVDRSKQKVTNLLFTITDRDGNIPDPDLLNHLIMVLEKSIKYSLRIGDVATQYSSSQIIVLLMDTDDNNGRMVSERILDNFHNTINNEDINVICNIQMLSIS